MKILITLKSGRKHTIFGVTGYNNFREMVETISPDGFLIVFENLAIPTKEVESIKQIG